MSELERAWAWREAKGVLAAASSVRVFHGPGEGTGELERFSIDRFGENYWVTEWQPEGGAAFSAAGRARIREFLGGHGAKSAVVLWRPESGVPEDPEPLLGEPPRERFEAEEGGARYWIRVLGTKHPGLFLDHAPLREWLRAQARGWRVLNTFAYTGSLSVAAGLGGAAHVATLDLSKPSLRWAEDNWALNGLDAGAARFLAGDFFERVPRLKRAGELFDCVILDPPSFSRGEKGSFSTAKDLSRLHSVALSVLAPGGVLVTSINSANVSWKKFEADIESAARSSGRELEVLRKLDLPETFPTHPGRPEERYLKGFVLRAKSK